jgi:hypothetical protein
MTPFACAAASTSRSASAIDTTSASGTPSPYFAERASSGAPSRSSSITMNALPSSATSSSSTATALGWFTVFAT